MILRSQFACQYSPPPCIGLSPPPLLRTHFVHILPCPTSLLLPQSATLRSPSPGLAAMASRRNRAFPEGIDYKKVTILNPAKEELVGVLDDTGSKELVILCHGFRSSKESSTLNKVASPLLEVGLTTFRFDFSGNGESQGEFQYGNYWKEVEDLRSVVLYWLTQGRIVKAIIGHSKGGNVVLLYASKYGDVHTVVNLSGRFALERGMAERLGDGFFRKIEEEGFLDVRDKSGNVAYRVTKESVKERLNIDMKLAASSIVKGCRVLTVHGSEDEVVTMEDAHEFNKLIPNHTLQIVAGANHVYSQHSTELTAFVLKFLLDIQEDSADDTKQVKP